MMPTLADKIIRHQVYLEGLKFGELGQANAVLRSIERDIRASLVGISSEGLGTLSKARLLKLMRTLRLTLVKRYNAYTDHLLKFLEQFMFIEFKHMRAIFADEIEPNKEPEEPNQDLAAFWWPKAKSSILPANGLVLFDFIKALGVAGSLAATQTLMRSAANRDSLSDTTDAVAALRGRLEAQARSVLATALQSVSAQSQAAFAKIVGIERYEWVSVLDNRTSDICRNRSGKRYYYYNGPLPPAHPNCRSCIVPVIETADIPNPNFKEWVNGLPANVRSDMFAGNVGEKFEGTRSITLRQFEDKTELILA